MRVLCLGNPKMMRDAFGPMVGSALHRKSPSLQILGTMESPIWGDKLTPTAVRWLDLRQGSGILVDTVYPPVVEGLTGSENGLYIVSQPNIVSGGAHFRAEYGVFWRIESAYGKIPRDVIDEGVRLVEQIVSVADSSCA